MEISNEERRRAFVWWLRTGRLPSVRQDGGIEYKFNPYHDPNNGRFTFAGLGTHYGAGSTRPTRNGSGETHNIADQGKLRNPRQPTPPKAQSSHTRQGEETQPRHRPNSAVEFATGVGEGVYGVAENTFTDAYSALTTNPVTTVRNAELGIAGMIDAAIAAEDTPARVQVSRAADAVANASARDIGRVTGSAVGNAVLTVAPGAAVAKVSSLRRLRLARARPTFDPPKIRWVKENLGHDTPAKRYNDTAPGARPGQAPALMRTIADGSKRPVKFDGVHGEYVIDRKFGISGKPNAQAQILRQSDVLAQHDLIGIWEVPNET